MNTRFPLNKLSYPTLVFILVSTAIIVFSNSLGNSFIWDDWAVIVWNDIISSLKNLPLFFTSSLSFANARLTYECYRPFAITTYAVDYYFWGANAFGYHLSNLVIHILNGVLLFFLIIKISRRKIIALFTSLIFLVHPVQTEAVDWISGRDDMLFLFFCLSSLIFYINSLREAKLRYWLCSIALYILGLLSKEAAVVLPAVMFLYEMQFKRCKCSYKSRIGSICRRLSPYVIVTLAYILIRQKFTGSFSQGGWWAGEWAPTLLTMIKCLGCYIKLMFLPVNLCADYLTFPIIKGLDDISLYAIIAVVIIMFSSAVYFFKKLRLVSFGILWFFISLLPVSNIILPVRIIMAERFLYMPVIGIALSFSSVTYLLSVKFRKKKILSYANNLLMVLIVLILSALTYERNFIWKDDITFNEGILKVYPDNPRAHWNLAFEYLKNKTDLDKAFEHLAIYEQLKESDKKRVDMVDSKSLFALYYYEKGDIHLARKIFEEDAVNLGNFAVFKHLAHIYIMEKKYDKAEQLYRDVLAANSYNIDAVIGLAVVALLKGDNEGAVKLLENVVGYKILAQSDFKYAYAYLLLGDMYNISNREEDAFQIWRVGMLGYERQRGLSYIFKYLCGEIPQEIFIDEVKKWQIDMRNIAFYFAGVKSQIDGDPIRAGEYYGKCEISGDMNSDITVVLAAYKLKKLS